MTNPVAHPSASPVSRDRRDPAQPEQRGEPGDDFSRRLARSAEGVEHAGREGLRPPSAMLDREALDQLQAERFNEHGFFGDAVALRADQAAQPTSPLSVKFDSAPAEIEAPIGNGRLAGIAERSVRSVLPLPLISVRSAPSDPAPLVDGAKTVIAAAAITGIDPGKSRPLLPPARTMPSLPAHADRQRADGAKSNMSIAIHALAEGLRVVARLGRMEPHERERMRTEIAALLAIHGYSPREISVQGPQASTGG
ncbi:hypothetical protein D1610_02135 [Sphingomonas gilva]|uniref:Uncharacterized protein n=1 Tax=Sphingomonas gilva TaxID=2305907 RepID=A0A396RQQ4_9SPHN|nr:hypothetical protein [Sphingomonas gilva]RHW18957.1 hypothetical protein D1610_02135 [Sphingomonas gilva]